MNAVSFPEVYADDDAPPTERAPASGIAKLVARMRETREEDTLSRTPSIDLIALSAGAERDAIAVMRTHYANGDMDHALAVAASIAEATNEDSFGGLILVTDEEGAALDADIEEIDGAFIELDLKS